MKRLVAIFIMIIDCILNLYFLRIFYVTSYMYLLNETEIENILNIIMFLALQETVQTKNKKVSGVHIFFSISVHSHAFGAELCTSEVCFP